MRKGVKAKYSMRDEFEGMAELARQRTERFLNLRRFQALIERLEYKSLGESQEVEVKIDR